MIEKVADIGTQKAADIGARRAGASSDLRGRIATLTAEGGSGFVGRAQSDRSRVLVMKDGWVRDITIEDARGMLGRPSKKRS